MFTDIGDADQQLVHACQELQRRLDAGDDCRAEELLAAFPALAAREDHAVDLICTEFRLRRRRGEPSTPEEWLARFPQWRDQLEHQLCREDVLVSRGTSGLTTVPDLPAGGASEAATGAEGGVQTLGRYEELGVLGRGGMGIVCKARDRLLDRIVALKKIRSGSAAHAEEVQRFFREARALARLRHPHIVPVHDIGEDRGEPFFTMDFVGGGSLKDRRDLFGGDIRTVVVLMEKVARAVQAAHEQGVIHRDLKPGNVLLNENGEPRVSDFGLAKLADADESITREGQALGTPAYMAPEQVTGGAKDATAQSDVWSLGVMLYELLTGQRPYEGKNIAEVAQRLVGAGHPRPRSLRPELDRNLEAVVVKCLEPSPGARYPCAGALADDLSRWLQRLPTSARPEGWAGWSWRQLRRHRTVVAAALLLVGLGVLFLTLAWAGRQRSPEEEMHLVERNLAAGKRVELVGPTGMPRWHRLEGRGGLSLPDLGGGCLQVSCTGGHALVELVRAVPCDRYLFHADVRHDSSNGGDVGLFWFHGRQEMTGGPFHELCTLTFADYGQRGGRLEFNARLLREPHPHHAARCLERQIERRPEEWRHLAVRVTPQEIQAFWEENPLKPVSRTALAGKAASIATVAQMDSSEIRVPAFAAAGGLGLYVYDSAAYFRNVVVEPIK